MKYIQTSVEKCEKSLLKVTRTVISVCSLILVISVSPYFSEIASAQNFWIRLAQELFIEAAKEGVRSYWGLCMKVLSFDQLLRHPLVGFSF
ncbi:hypothetical protein OsccyDRAFT_3522 [Leptolyngbyaceae cyanobacterium JSC-12]|nr:hypothetical protein OsccyDRAFT_3522 [Leptolyngbyaceae cyanobacterium JSC-12]